ncbi:hypothetical protein SHIRM173S_07815 [Streptomyces hirsutus]
MTTPNVWNWHRPPWHGEPRLLAQLEVDHPDGSRTTVVSGDDWRLAEGPTRSNSLYAGETFDARLVPDGWTRPGFDDSGWRAARIQEAPAGRLRAQPHDPIEIDTISRNRLTGLVAGEGAHPLTLDQLTAEAHDLLARRLGADRLAAEPEAADEIITRCGRLPLALAIVAAPRPCPPRLPAQRHRRRGERQPRQSGRLRRRRRHQHRRTGRVLLVVQGAARPGGTPVPAAGSALRTSPRPPRPVSPGSRCVRPAASSPS